MAETQVAILGGGLAGLSAAFHLSETDYQIYEQERRVGGVAKSIYQDGFIFDHGPHILYTANPYAAELIKRLLGSNLQAQAREAWIYHLNHDCYTQFPFQANLHGLPQQIVKECILGFFEALRRHREEGQRHAPKNYEEWIYATFGEGIARHLMVPYAKKIWTIPPSRMNYEWIGRRVPQPELGQILDGALGDASERVGFNNEFWYPLQGGIEALPQAFLPHVRSPQVGRRVIRIRVREKRLNFDDGSSTSYEHLISTLPLNLVVKLIDNVPTRVLEAADRLEYNSILCVNFGVNRERITDKHWIYFYEEEFYGHRVSFPMNLSGHTTPAGKSSVTCEVAYSKYRKINREHAIERVAQDLIRAHIMTPEDTVCAENVKGITPAYIIYDHDHRMNVGIVRQWLLEHDVYSCGRFGEWEYFNMDHSIMSGKRAAEAISRRVGALTNVDDFTLQDAPRQPRVAVVVLNWNNWDDTQACVEHMKRAHYANLDIIVVDNGSRDGSLDRLRGLSGIHLVENGANLGFGDGTNVGIREALKRAARYVLILNNDTQSDPDFLREMVAAMEADSNIGVVAPKIYYADRPDVIWSIGGQDIFTSLSRKTWVHDVKDIGQFADTHDVEFVWTCAMLVRRQVFEDVGLLDGEYFVGTEDFDFCLRVRSAGYRLQVVPSAKLWHRVSASTGGQGYTPALRYFIGRGSVLFMRKHARWWQWPGFFLTFWGAVVVALAREACRGNSRAVMAKARGFVDGLKDSAMVNGRLEGSSRQNQPQETQKDARVD